VDYVTEVEHQASRIERLERAIDDAMVQVPKKMRRVIKGPSPELWRLM
jgi:hypothetical protein